MRRTLLLLLLSAFPAALPAAAGETPAELIRLPEPAGLARLVRPLGAVAPPLVVLLPDRLGEDGRSEPYVDSLLARGIATLALGLGEDLESPATPVEPAAAPEALAPALDWARAAGFAPEATGVLGFGLGGRAALAGAEGLPMAALYPGCRDLALPRSGPALVMQGGDAAEGCAALDPPPRVILHLLPGVGHAWDAPGAIWPSPGPLLPDPAGGGLLRSRRDLTVTLIAAEAIADWFEAALPVGARQVAR
jgi:dienelactone hydrolase